MTRLNPDSEYNGGRLAACVGVLAILFVYCSFVEMQYAFSGQVATATVTRAQVYPASGHRNPAHLVLGYQFTESSGNFRSGSDDVALDDHPPSIGSKIEVEYLPGQSGKSRKLGTNYLAFVTAGLLTLSVALVCVSFYFRVKVRESPYDALSYDGLIQ